MFGEFGFALYLRPRCEINATVERSGKSWAYF